MKKTYGNLFLTAFSIIIIFLQTGTASASATVEDLIADMAANAGTQPQRYEYKIVRLGSLSGLQNENEKSDNKLNGIEDILNREGLKGWDMVNIFAVRTTFDPNVFFVAMKRPLPEEKK